MRIGGILLLAWSIIAGSATAVGAQESGRVGITMGYPSSIGVLWHVSNRVALRPEFSFAWSDSSSESLVSAETNFWTLGSGISALFYAPVTDNLRTYAAPRFSYGRTRGNSDVTESITGVYTVAGMFGAQYLLGRRFAAFGEVGLSYARQTGTVTSTLGSVITRTTNHGNAVATRTGVGVVLYF